MNLTELLSHPLLYLFATIGALYVIALFVVKLTPTPRDDEALKEVGGFLRAVAKVFGLDLKQGRAKKPRPKRTPIPPGPALGFALCLLLLPGCASAGDQYQASSFAFVAAVDAATELRKADKFDQTEIEVVGAAIDEGNKALNLWAEALKREQDYPDGQAVLSSVVLRIREYVTRARTRKKKE